MQAIAGALEEICRERTALSLVEADREIDKLLKQGVKVSFPFGVAITEARELAVGTARR